METAKYTGIYRAIHWAIAIAFFLLLVTIFLRLTWMNKTNVAEIIQNYMKDTDQSLSQDQLIGLAKKIRKPMWEWHIYIGYVLAGLFSIRFMLPLFGRMRFQNPMVKKSSHKEKFQKWLYILFYGCVAVSLITGIVIESGPESLKKTMEEIHILSIYYLVPYILIHLAGVFIAEFTDRKGIISEIISGPSDKMF